MPSLYGGRGLGNYFDSLSALPQAAYTFSNAIGQGALQGMENTRLWKESENARERQRRDEKTAERKARQGMLTNIGIGVGGAALGAGIGSLLAAPAATAATAGTTAGINAAVDTAVASGAGATTAGANAAGASIANAALGGTAAGAGAGAAVGGGLGGAAGSAGYGKFFSPEAMASYAPKPNQFGYLGNTRGQVFGNLFLQGAASQIPGFAGVAQGINSANQMNYQMGRDAIGDQRWQQQFGLQQEGIGIDREQLAATIANQQFKQGISAADLQRKIAEDAARNNRFGLSLDSTNQYRSDIVGLGRDRLNQTIANDTNRLGLGQERNDIMRERNTLGAGGTQDTDFIRNYNFMTSLDPKMAGQYSQIYSGLTPRPAATDPTRQMKDRMGIIKMFDDIGQTGDPILDEQLGKFKTELSGGGANPQLSQLDTLLNSGQITQEQYNRKRKELGF